VTGLIDWDHRGINQPINRLVQQMAPGQACKKASAMQQLLATAAVKDTAPINPNQQEQNTWGPSNTRPDRCSAAIIKDVLFISLLAIHPKRIGEKGKKKVRPVGRTPARPQRPPARKNPTQPTTTANTLLPPFPLHPTCFLMAVLWAARLKNSPLGALRIQFHAWNGTDSPWGRRPSPSHGEAETTRNTHK